MPLRKYRPLTPATRFKTVPRFSEITRSRPERRLVEPLKRTGGRDNKGHISSWQRGGGHRRNYRVIDFRRDKKGIIAKVAHIEYDPNRSARIALLHYVDGEKRYILAPDGVVQGDQLMSGSDAEIRPGNALPLRNIPVGTFVYNVEMTPGKGGQISRSAGTYCQLMAKEGAE